MQPSSTHQQSPAFRNSVRSHLIPCSCFGKVTPFLRFKICVFHILRIMIYFKVLLWCSNRKVFLLLMSDLSKLPNTTASRFTGAHRREQGAEHRFLFRPPKEQWPLLACSQCFLYCTVQHFVCSIKHFQAYISKARSWPRTSVWMLQPGARCGQPS